MTTSSKNPNPAAGSPTKRAAPVTWLAEPQKHDYPAAASYLALVARPKQVRLIVAALQRAPVVHYKAKDILRASVLALLPRDNPHVAHDLDDVMGGRQLSPCLMVRGESEKGLPALIADGYHRVCASYYLDENTDIPVKIVKR